MFNLEELREQARDLCHRGGNEARVFAQRVISLLEAIHEEVQSEEFTERRIPNFLELTDDDTAHSIVTIPNAAEEWLLETVAVLDFTTLTVTADGRMVFAKQFAAADTVTPNVLLPRGAAIAITQEGNPVPVRVNVQFKTRTPRRTRPAVSGLASPVPDRHNPLESHLHAPA